MKKLKVMVLGLTFVIQLHGQSVLTPRQVAAAFADVGQTDPLTAEAVPMAGMFYSTQNPNSPPAPGNFFNLPAWDLGNGNYLLDDVDSDAQNQRVFSHRALDDAPPDPGDSGTGGGGSYTNYVTNSFDTNGLWLEMLNVTNGAAYLNLHNATNQVYAILTSPNWSSAWEVAGEVWPTNATVTPFALATLDDPSFFVRVQDWTQVTHGGNTIPDWWFWNYYGTTALSDTNLDSSGNALLFDYQNSLDPNVIFFAVNATNQFVNTSNATVQITVSGGIPGFMAALVDNLDYSNANWTPFNSNLTVNLGGAEGWHTVSVGIRGFAPSGQQTWSAIQLKLVLTPPVLIATNPVPGIVTRPLIQLQGYALGNFDSIHYDLSNAVSFLTNQQAFVTTRQFDSNNIEFTTNAFECFGVPLENGTNIITLHGVDLAGNTADTNLVYILDPAANTNPPVITLGWPQNNGFISGMAFPISGVVNDPFATVTVQIANASGTTSLSGLVEANGSFWIENVPLGSGSNFLVICATNAAGYGSATNITVVQSATALAIDSVSLNDPWAPTATVQGSLSGSTNPVWVNGVQANNNGDGTWTANDVPAGDAGTASFAAAATSGGDGIPRATDPQIAQNFPRNGSISLTRVVYTATLQIIGSEGEINWDNTEFFHLDWTYGLPGGCLFSLCATATSYTPTYNYDGASWDTTGNGPAIFGTSTHCGDTNAGGTNFGFEPPNWVDMAVGIEGNVQTSKSFPGSESTIQFQYNGSGRVPLKTGGQGILGQQNLWVIHAATTAGVPMDGYYGPDGPIPPSQVSIAGQQLDANSNAYFSLPDGTSVDATAKAPANAYYFALSDNQYTAQIQMNGVALSPTTTNATFCVGQKVQFTLSFSPSLPSSFGISNIVCHWKLPDKFVNTSNVNSAGCPIYANSPNLLTTTNGSCNCWYVDGTGGTASVGAHLIWPNGKTISVAALGKFAIYRPTVDHWQTNYLGFPQIDIISNRLVLGNPANNNNGMTFKAFLSSAYPSGTITGQAGFTQLISGTYASGVSTVLNDYELDQVQWYREQQDVYSTALGEVAFDDNPSVSLPSTLLSTNAGMSLQFEDYLRFTPSGANSIPVTLRLLTWSVNASATYDTGAGWLVDSGSSTTGPNITDNNQFPVWTNTFNP